MRIPNQVVVKRQSQSLEGWAKTSSLYPSQRLVILPTVLESLFCDLCRIQGCDCSNGQCVNCGPRLAAPGLFPN